MKSIRFHCCDVSYLLHLSMWNTRRGKKKNREGEKIKTKMGGGGNAPGLSPLTFRSQKKADQLLFPVARIAF